MVNPMQPIVVTSTGFSMQGLLPAGIKCFDGVWTNNSQGQHAGSDVKS